MIKKLERIVQQHTGKQITLTPETTIRDELGLNSLDLATLICNIEDEYDCEIPEESMPQIETVQDMLDLIVKIKEED